VARAPHLTAVGAKHRTCVSIDVTGKGVVGISITNTASGSAWAGAIQPQLAIGGDAAQNTTVTPYSSTTSQSTITACPERSPEANGTYQSYVTGAGTFSVCGNTVSNTANVKLQVSNLAAKLGGASSGSGGASVLVCMTTTALNTTSAGFANLNGTCTETGTESNAQLVMPRNGTASDLTVSLSTAEAAPRPSSSYLESTEWTRL
jgi:hypothetical protein